MALHCSGFGVDLELVAGLGVIAIPVVRQLVLK
jgi:hypothetical protein